MDNVRHSALLRNKPWLRGAALIALMIFLTGCAGLFGGPTAREAAFISGIVHEYGDEQVPIAGARVAVGERRTETDAEGRYALNDVVFAGSSVTMRVDAEGFKSRNIDIPKGSESNYVVNVALQRPDDPDGGNGEGDGDWGTDPGAGEPEPTYDGNVLVSIGLVNAPTTASSSAGPEGTPPEPGLRPVAAVRKTSATPLPDYVPGEWIVELDPASPVQPAHVRWHESGLRVERRLSDNFYLVVGDEADAAEVEARLAAMPDVVSFGRNRVVAPISVQPVVPNDEYYFRQWSLPLIGAPYAWALTTGNRDVVVAVLDTGLVDHDDIRSNKIVRGRNFVNDQGATNYRDNTNNFSHGTMVTGIIGADANNGTGVTGLAWNVTLMPVRVIGSNGGGSIAGVGDGIKYAVDNGAHIINMSLAWDSNPSDAGERYVRQQIEFAAAAGVVMIAGAGNDNGRVTMPAAHPDVIAVGAVDKYKRRTWYSNYGIDLDLVAPGGDQPTDAQYRDGVLSTDIANGRPYYTYDIGTSFAAPHVTGVVALMYSRGITDPYEIREILTDTAEDLGSPGYDVYYGHGLINAYAAVAGVRRTDAVVGVATEDGRVFGPAQAEASGEQAAAFVEGAAPGRQTVFAWIDVNGDGVLDEGDFAAVGYVDVPMRGTVQTELRLQIVDTLPEGDKSRLMAIVNR